MTEPTTVTEFLNKHGLPYAAAFEENGHDHLPSLLEASEEDLATVISDVKMRSGHAMRLRKIPARHVSATPLASSPPPPAAEPPASAPQSDPAQLRGDDPNAQAHMHKLLMAQNPFGNFIHGNIAETYCDPVTEKPTVIMANKKRFYCGQRIPKLSADARATPLLRSPAHTPSEPLTDAEAASASASVGEEASGIASNMVALPSAALRDGYTSHGSFRVWSGGLVWC